LTPSEGGSDQRVVIVPDELRELSSGLRDASEQLSWAGRRLITTSRPEMPSGVVGLVGDAIYRVNAELQELAIEFEDEARVLTARAAWAELGGGAGLGWLLPGLAPFPQVGSALRGPGHLIAPTPDIEPAEGHRWAEELLDRMPTPGDVTPVVIEQTTGPVDPYGDPFAEFSLTGSDLSSLESEGARADASGAVEGALRTGVSTDSSDPVAAGIAGCILVGFGPADNGFDAPPARNG
jgi:hypothetical protein